MLGILGKKVGMTSIFLEDGKNVACTVIEAGPCVVTQIKSKEIDGYNSVQISFDDKKEKNTSRAEQGHFKKASSTPKRKVVEFRDFGKEVNLGDVLSVAAGVVRTYWFYRRVDYGESGGGVDERCVSAGDITGLA